MPLTGEVLDHFSPLKAPSKHLTGIITHVLLQSAKPGGYLFVAGLFSMDAVSIKCMAIHSFHSFGSSCPIVRFGQHKKIG